MSINGFVVNGTTHRYNYNSLDNLPEHHPDDLAKDIRATNGAILATKSGVNFGQFVTIPGLIVKATGEIGGSSTQAASYSSSPMLPVEKNALVRYSGLYALTAFLVLAVYDSTGTFDSEYGVSGQGSSGNVSGSFIMPYDGFIRLTNRNGAVEASSVFITGATDQSIKSIQNDLEAASRGSYANVNNRNFSDFLTDSGLIQFSDGNDYNSSTVDSGYARSGFIAVGKHQKIAYKNLQTLVNYCVLAVYNSSKEYDAAYSIAGQGGYTNVVGELIMPYDGYIRLSCRKAQVESAVAEITTSKKELNILVLGNSFSQDSFAYLPPILNELLPDRAITYGVAYTSSASIQDHINFYNNGVKYTWWNYWGPTSNSWARYTSSGDTDNGKNLSEIIHLKDWDVIYVQPASGVTQESGIIANIVSPGRELLRLLSSLTSHPFIYLMGQWLSTSSNNDRGEEVFPYMVQAMGLVKSRLGINDYIPIGTAIQNARTNDVLQALGSGGNMLYSDGQHMQSGIPPLIAAYVIALKIVSYCGGAITGIYNSSFIPTTDNCIAINAYKTGGMTTPLPMTHGDSVGVEVSEGQINYVNLRAAQEIAVLAVNNPSVITDCSNILV